MNPPIRAVIIDDEINAIRTLEKVLKEIPGIEIAGEACDPATAGEIVADIKPDILFLDIQMPGKNGFEIAREIQKAGLSPEIIFVTAFDQFAIEAIRNAAFDYILKPVNPAELNAAITRFRERKLNRAADKTGEQSISARLDALVSRLPAQGKLKFSTGSGFIMVNPDDIVYIEADWNYSEIYYNDEKHEMITTNIGSIEKILPAQGFYRISRSVIINLSYLNRVNRKKRIAFLTKDGKEYTFKIPLLNIRKMERFLEQ